MKPNLDAKGITKFVMRGNCITITYPDGWESLLYPFVYRVGCTPTYKGVMHMPLDPEKPAGTVSRAMAQNIITEALDQGATITETPEG